MKLKNQGIVFVLLVFDTASLLSQTYDFGLWTTLGMEKNLGRLKIGTETEIRLKQNTAQLDRWSVRLDAAYSLLKRIDAGAGYQILYFNDSKYSDFQIRHRTYFFLQGKYKSGNFTFSLRERFQRTTKDDTDRIKESGKIDTYNINPDLSWRNRLKLTYDIPFFPVNPSISFESFYQFNNPDGNRFDKLRFTLSFNYKLKKNHEFEAYGLLDKEININDPVQLYVAGVAYVYSF